MHSTRFTRLRRVALTWIAICFAVSATGLGAWHGCSGENPAGERLAHHHGGATGEKTPLPPSPSRCDCVGRACCHAPVAAPSAGITLAISLEETDSPRASRSVASRPVTPYLLPYATAPPLIPAV